MMEDHKFGVIAGTAGEKNDRMGEKSHQRLSLLLCSTHK